MARIRTVKPELFKHEDLAELPPLDRLLFIGLFCLADREGRLEDRPKRIKAELLPYDNANIPEMLKRLEGGGFVTLYSDERGRYIQIDTFTKHQRITGKESQIQSQFPAPQRDTAGRHCFAETGNNGETLGKDQMPRKGKEGEFGTGKHLGSGRETEGNKEREQEQGNGNAERGKELAVENLWKPVDGSGKVKNAGEGGNRRDPQHPQSEIEIEKKQHQPQHQPLANPELNPDPEVLEFLAHLPGENPWRPILERIGAQVQGVSYEHFLKPTVYAGVAGKTLVVQSAFPRELFRWKAIIMTAVDQLKMPFDNVRFVPSLPVTPRGRST